MEVKKLNLEEYDLLILICKLNLLSDDITVCQYSGFGGASYYLEIDLK